MWLVHPVATMTLASPEDPAMHGFCKPLGMFKGAPKIEGPKAESGGEVFGEGAASEFLSGVRGAA